MTEIRPGTRCRMAAAACALLFCSITATLALHLSAADQAAAESLVVRGPIVGVDADRALVSVEDGELGAITFEVPRGARIALDGEEGAIVADLFAGDSIVRADLRLSRAERWYLVAAEVSSTES